MLSKGPVHPLDFLYWCGPPAGGRGRQSDLPHVPCDPAHEAKGLEWYVSSGYESCCISIMSRCAAGMAVCRVVPEKATYHGRWLERLERVRGRILDGHLLIPSICRGRCSSGPGTEA